jgi:cystathionine beta-lyase/cystathionine gamma-synthase
MNWRTKLIHSERKVPEGFRSLATPVFRGSTTLFCQASAIVDTWNHDDVPYSYGSYGTPTTLELAARIAELEGGYRSFVTPGGQSALILIYMACLSAGDHVLVPESIYGPSRAFADQVLRRYGVGVEYYLPLEGPSLSKRIRDNTRLVWCESPGSITMEIQDVPAIIAAAHARSVPVALDNTWGAGVAIAESAVRVAKWLAGRSEVENVLHPALPSCPGHEIWKRDFTGSSGLFSVVYRRPFSRQDLHRCMDRLRLFQMGYSWGGVSSLVVTPDLDEAPNARAYGDRLVRFYVGLEDPEDLIGDIEQAFRL